jgi:lipopolysaccharide biosynthesis glycosyltransferase
MFLADRLVRLQPPPGTEIIVYCDSDEAIAQGVRWAKVPCEIRKISVPFNLRGNDRISGATYYRFFAPDLSKATNRVLYLDTDTYPENHDIWRLFDLDMGNRAIAACRSLEYAYAGFPGMAEELRATGSPNGKYLNAGVMLFDMKRTVRLKLNEKFLAAAQRNSVNDQTAINSVLRGQWCELSPAFNMTMLGHLIGLPATFPPVISHFMGDVKPWHGDLFYLPHRARPEIEQFIAGSPWPDFILAQMKKRGWQSGQIVTHDIHPAPSEFLAKVKAFVAQTQFADRS